MRGTMAIAALMVTAATAGPAFAISDEQCDRQYEAARTTQSLNGMDRQTYGRAQCATQTENNAEASPAQTSKANSPTTPQANKPNIVVPTKP